MNSKAKIIDVNLSNISSYPARCLMSPKDKSYEYKAEWLKKRFTEGLIIKQLYIDSSNTCLGFIEYVPGEYAWRAVDAGGYIFIHCLWVYKTNIRSKGFGSILIKESIKEAKRRKCYGVAVVVSTGAFMSDKEIYLKNGFRSVETSGKFELLVFSLKNSKLPKFKDWKAQLKKYKGLNAVYSNQCPWVAKSIDVLSSSAGKYGIELKVTQLKTAKQAQNAPSVYSVFSLINNGKIVEDHYISETRFKNILRKEILPNSV
jgi:GNAT superfamily N-acetyltransferase